MERLSRHRAISNKAEPSYAEAWLVSTLGNGSIEQKIFGVKYSTTNLCGLRMDAISADIASDTTPYAGSKPLDAAHCIRLECRRRA